MTTAPGSRSALRTLGVVAGVLLVLVAVAWAALAILFPPAKLRAIVARQLSTALVRPVRFEDAHLSLWPPVRLAVTNLAMSEPGGFTRGTMFRTQELNLDLDVWALLSHRMVIRSLTLDGPELHIVLGADGGTNLDGIGRPAAAQPPASQQPMDLSVNEFSITNGSVLVDDLSRRRRTMFDIGTHVALDVRGGTRVNTHGETRIEHLAFGTLAAARPADFDRSLAALTWRIEHRGAFDSALQRLAFEQLALRFGNTSLALSGIVDHPGLRPAVDLKARGAGVDIAEILGFLGHADARALQGIHGAGALDFDLGIRGALGAGPAGAAPRLPAITGTMRLANAWFQYPGAPARVEGLAFHARFAPDSLGIGDLVASVKQQPLRAALVVTHFADPHVRFGVQGNIDLAAVAPFLVASGGNVSGRAAVDLRGEGRARDPGAMALSGRALLSNVRVKQPALAREFENVQGTIEFSQTQASITGLTGQAGKTQFALDARVDRPLALLAKPGDHPMPEPAGVSFAFRAPYLDVAEVMPRGGGGIVLPNARGGGTVAIGRLRNQRLDMTAVQANVTLEPTALAVPNFTGRIYEGLMAGAARFDLADTSRPVITVNARLDSARIERVLGTWVPPGNWLSGSLSTSIDLNGNLKDLQRSLTAAGLAAVWNGAFAQSPLFDRIAEFARIPAFRRPSFHDLKSNFRVDHGRVFTGPATLHGPQGDWLVGGSIGLDGTLDYAVSVTVPPTLVQQLGARAALAAGALADDQGRVLLDFRVSGPARAPRVAWDPAAMQSRLMGRASQAIEQEKQKYEQVVRDTLAAQQRAMQDSARAVADRYRRATTDSLAGKGRKLLEGWFGRVTTPPPPADTTHR